MPGHCREYVQSWRLGYQNDAEERVVTLLSVVIELFCLVFHIGLLRKCSSDCYYQAEFFFLKFLKNIFSNTLL